MKYVLIPLLAALVWMLFPEVGVFIAFLFGLMQAFALELFVLTLFLWGFRVK